MKKTMKWTLLALLIVAAMTLAACGGNTAGGNNSTTAPETTGAPVGSGHTHCVCGGDAAGLGEHTCADVENWVEWPGIDKVTDGGHYYLTGDLEGTPLTWYAETKNFSLCLNGHNVTMTDHINLDGTLTICDCAETQGTVTSSLNDAEATGALVSVLTDGKLTIYGGNYTHADGCKVLNGGIFISKGAAVDMYGGNVYNFTAVNNGGNFYVDQGSTLTLYGGKVSNKADVIQATRGANIYAYGSVAILGDGVVVEGGSSNHGASIYMDLSNGEQGTFKMTGGTLTGAVTTGNGGNLYTKVKTDITGGKIVSGTAGKGGNVFVTLGATLTISGAELSSGSATEGGNLYVSSTEGTNAIIESGTILANGTAEKGGNICTTNPLVINGGTITGGDVYMNNSVGAFGSVTINGGNVEKLTAGVGPWNINKVDAPLAIHVLNAKNAIINLNLKNLASDSAAITITANDTAVPLVAYIDVDTLPANVQAAGMKIEAQSAKLWKLVQG